VFMALPSIATAIPVLAELNEKGATHASSPINSIGLVFLLLTAYWSRNEPTGGWLRIFIYQIYIGCVATVFTIHNLWDNFFPSTWGDDSRYPLFLVGHIPTILMVFIMAAVVSLLLYSRHWKFVRLLRVLFFVQLIFVGINVTISAANFGTADAILASLQGIFLLVWIPYFYASRRVKETFGYESVISNPPPLMQ